MKQQLDIFGNFIDVSFISKCEKYEKRYDQKVFRQEKKRVEEMDEMLVKRSKKATNYVLPVCMSNGFKTNWYYENESQLFRAYNQLKSINIGIKPLYPVVY